MRCDVRSNSWLSSWYYRDTDYPSTTRPEGVLTVAMFARHQRVSAGQLLQSLTEECWRRYTYACDLAGVCLNDDTPSPRNPIPDLTPMIYPWDKLCCWYRANHFDRQLNLFECPYQAELTRWYEFVENRCFAEIYRFPERVERVLATVGLGRTKVPRSGWEATHEDDNEEPLFGWVQSQCF